MRGWARGPRQPARCSPPKRCCSCNGLPQQVFVHHAVAHYIVRLVMATREPHAYGVPTIASLLDYGVSPRGSLGLLAASRALALLRGRDYVLPTDVADIAPNVLSHRLVLTSTLWPTASIRAMSSTKYSSPLPNPQIAPAQPRSRRGRLVTSHPFRTLDLGVRRRIDSLVAGDHEGMRLGVGSEREEVVRYQPGDDVRRIDWNITARSTDMHVWRPRADNQLDTWVLLDVTPSMAFGTVNGEKRDARSRDRVGDRPVDRRARQPAGCGHFWRRRAAMAPPGSVAPGRTPGEPRSRRPRPSRGRRRRPGRRHRRTRTAS